MPVELGKIKGELVRLGDPLKDSADNVHRTFVNFTTFVETEFQPYLKDLLERIDISDKFETAKNSFEAYLKVLPSIEKQFEESKALFTKNDGLEGIKESIIKSKDDLVRGQESVSIVLQTLDVKGSLKEFESAMRTIVAGIATPNGLLERLDVSIKEMVISTKNMAKALEELTVSSHTEARAGGVWDFWRKR